MPNKRRRRASVPAPAWERERGAIGRRVGGRSFQFYATVIVVLLLIASLGAVGAGFLIDWRQDQGRPGSAAIRVGDKDFSVRYFTQRLEMFVQESGGVGNAAGMAQNAFPATSENLINEGIFLTFAGEQGQTTTQDEENAEIAARLSITKDDPNFQTRFQEELVRSGLTEDEYREIARAAVLRRKVAEKFTSELPGVAESINYRQIVVATQAEADDIKTQGEGGADFAAIAKEKSLDTATKDTGGDKGWAPRSFLDVSLEDILFPLEAGKVITEPTSGGVFVYQVVVKEPARPIKDSHKSTLAQRKLLEWITEKRGQVEIVNHMDLTNPDLDKFNYAFERVYQTS